MKPNEQTIQQIDRAIRKVAEKFPASKEATILTDIHLRVNQETGELVAFDDDDREITRLVVEQWIDNTDDSFYQDVATSMRHRLEKQKATVEAMSVINPFAFVLEDEEREPVAELFVVDDETVIIDPDMMQDLDTDLDAFLDKLLKE